MTDRTEKGGQEVDEVAYWYPTQARATAIDAELCSLERLSGEQARRLVENLPLISHTLGRALEIEGFPQHQIGQWTWVASQFRMLAAADEAGAVVAGTALNFLGKRVDTGKFDAATTQDLNWALDSAVRRLRGKMSPGGLRSCLTSSELIAIESCLAQFTSMPEFDADAIRLRVQGRLGELEALSLDVHIDRVGEKVDTLFEASARRDKEGAAARAALLYLADKDDAVGDTLGVVGLLDDVYVIDWAFAVVERLTRCLPLLLAFLDQWPFVADLALVGTSPMPLDRFSQYIACAGLNSLFDERQPGLLIVRESAGYGAIVAVCAAVQCAAMQGNGLDAEIGKWRKGQPVIISDGQQRLNALFKGVEMLGDKPKIRLGVRGSGSSLTVDTSVAPYMACASAPHKQLCDGSKLLVWLKNRHLDPLVTLTGSSRRKWQQQECVLLLGPRHKLDDYFSCLRPFGGSAAALLGAKYVSADLTHHDLDHGTSDTPFIYACSDPATALDLITKPPEHVSGWRVIVDGARAGRTLRGSLQATLEHANLPVCIIGELHEREAAAELLSSGMSVWYLEDQDVEAPPSTAPRTSDKDDPLVKSLRRSGGHWAQTLNIRNVRSDFLECAAACLGKSKSSGGGETSTQALEYAVAAFIQKATSHPLQSPEIERQLGGDARKIASQASVISLYDTCAAEILALFRQWGAASVPPKANRQSELIDLIESIPPARSIAVVCRSERVADSCRVVTEAHPKLKRVTWTNLECLRRSAPYDCVIVPGWLDKMSMREIANNGYAGRLELILYPFEERWFNSTREASQKWERRLKEKTATSLRGLPAFSKLKTSGVSLWMDQVEERVKAAIIDPQDKAIEEKESPVFEEIEARAIAALQKRIAQGRADHPTVSAQLVLFEEDGAYAFLPPAGRVIVLADAHGQLDNSLMNRGDAEGMLFRKVSTLKSGMVLAFSRGDDRDLVDAWADQFIQNAAAVRATAGAWKDALKRHLNPTTRSYVDFSRRMAREGESRDPDTVRTWATHTNSIAPRNYRVLVPLIAKLTGDLDLQRRMPQVLAAIAMIYRARAQAADAIVREIFSGKIDVNAAQLSFELNGVLIGYSLHRIRELAGLQEAPIELIGKIGSLSDGSQVLLDL